MFVSGFKRKLKIYRTLQFFQQTILLFTKHLRNLQNSIVLLTGFLPLTNEPCWPGALRLGDL